MIWILELFLIILNISDISDVSEKSHDRNIQGNNNGCIEPLRASRLESITRDYSDYSVISAQKPSDADI